MFEDVESSLTGSGQPLGFCGSLMKPQESTQGWANELAGKQEVNDQNSEVPILLLVFQCSSEGRTSKSRR